MFALTLAIVVIATLCVCANIYPSPNSIAVLRDRIEARQEAADEDYAACVAAQDEPTRMRLLSLAIASPQDQWSLRYLRAYTQAGFSCRFTPILTRTGQVTLTLSQGADSRQCRMFLNDTLELLTETEELADLDLDAPDLDIVEVTEAGSGTYDFLVEGTLSESVSRS